MWKDERGKRNSATQKFPIERKKYDYIRNIFRVKYCTTMICRQAYHNSPQVHSRFPKDLPSMNENKMITYACRAIRILDAKYCFYTMHTNLWICFWYLCEWKKASESTAADSSLLVDVEKSSSLSGERTAIRLQKHRLQSSAPVSSSGKNAWETLWWLKWRKSCGVLSVRFSEWDSSEQTSTENFNY